MLSEICFQCFDAVGWAAGRACGLQKQSCGGAGVVVCLEQGADKLYDLHAIFIPDYQFQKVFLCFLR